MASRSAWLNVRRSAPFGRYCTLRVTAVLAVHHRLLADCQPLDGGPGVPVIPAQRQARREYENRVNALVAGNPR